MSAIRNTMFLGVAFFTVRIVMALVFGLILLAAFEEFRTVQTVLVSLIIFNLGLGALTDLILIYGAKNRKIVLIHIWNYAQFFVGGALCCMLIKPYVDLVQVTFEAIREIKKEILEESRIFHIRPKTQPPTKKKFGIL